MDRLVAQAGLDVAGVTIRDRAASRLDDLAGMGLRISIDDYGTGYSSLAHLKRLPISELKIGRSFVMNITEDQKDALIIASTVELGHDLGLRVAAEGVEREEDWIGLQMPGCDVAQGCFLGRPMPPGRSSSGSKRPGGGTPACPWGAPKKSDRSCDPVGGVARGPPVTGVSRALFPAQDRAGCGAG